MGVYPKISFSSIWAPCANKVIIDPLCLKDKALRINNLGMVRELLQHGADADSKSDIITYSIGQKQFRISNRIVTKWSKSFYQ